MGGGGNLLQDGVAPASGTMPNVQPPIQRVLIVSAGIAGLSAARALQKQGIAFDIIDAQTDVGGVWNCGYSGLNAQGEPTRTHFLITQDGTQMQNIVTLKSFHELH